MDERKKMKREGCSEKKSAKAIKKAESEVEGKPEKTVYLGARQKAVRSL